MDRQTRTFAVDGQEYEIRIWPENGSTFVRCFKDGKPASFRYSVSDEDRSDAQAYGIAPYILEALRGSAITDVMEGRYPPRAPMR